MTKVRKGVAVDGPAFLSVLAPFNRGWRIETDIGLKAAELTVETCFWPLFEVQNGKWMNVCVLHAGQNQNSSEAICSAFTPRPASILIAARIMGSGPHR